MLMSDLRRDFLQTSVENLSTSTSTAIAEKYQEIVSGARAQCAQEGISPDQMYVERYADMRYLGQEHTIKVELRPGEISGDAIQLLIQDFHAAHAREYAFRLDNQVELVNFHVVVFGKIEKQPLSERARSDESVEVARKGTRKVDFDEHGVP